MSEIRKQERWASRGNLPSELQSLRRRIDEIDSDLIDLMADRLEVAREAVVVKEANGLRRVDLAREAEVVRRAGEKARETGLEPEMTRDVFWRLIGLSRWAAGEGDGR